MAVGPDLYRVTWWWKSLGQSGSETMLIRRPDTQLGAVADSVKPMLQKRAKLLGNFGQLSDYRVARYTSSTGQRIRNRSEPRKAGFEGTQTAVNSQGQTIDVTGENFVQSLEIAMFSPTDDRRKILYLGYPWEVVLSGNMIYTPIAAFTTQLQSWWNDLIAGGYGWIGQTQGDPFGITTYVQDPATGKVTITVDQDVAWPSTVRPFRVHIGFDGRNPLDGPQTVVRTGVRTVQTVKSFGVRDFPLAGVGGLALYTYDFISLAPNGPGTQPVGRIAVVGPVGRKRGKSAPGTAGRSPTVVRW